jgi:phosphomethylpyrimidine synthase
MSKRRQTRANAQQFIDNLKPLLHPNSRKVYLAGSHHNIQVGMRAISQTDTILGGTEDNPVIETNPDIIVYDCAGPYSDPEANIDVRKGLAKFRHNWIMQRGDVEQLLHVSSGYTQERMTDDGLEHLRFDSIDKP